MNEGFYKQVGARHAQFQDGAITYSEFINALIALGVKANCLLLSVNYFTDKEN